MQEGRYVARAIRRGRAGKARAEPFRYTDKGTMAVIGLRRGGGARPGLRLRGFLGWITWLGVHLYDLNRLPQPRRRLLPLWGWDYVRRDRPTRMITTVEPDPVADALMS